MGIDLGRGQAVRLDKRRGGRLPRIRLGLGWRAAQPGGFLGRVFGRRREADLDASAVLFADGEARDVVYFRKLTSSDGSVSHSGDSLTGGEDREDDESITVDLERVPEHIDQIVFTVSSFTGRRFTEVAQARCRLVDETTGEELARYTLAGGGEHTGQVMAKVHRAGSGWELIAIGAPARGRTFQELLPAVKEHL